MRVFEALRGLGYAGGYDTVPGACDCDGRRTAKLSFLSGLPGIRFSRSSQAVRLPRLRVALLVTRTALSGGGEAIVSLPRTWADGAWRSIGG